MAIDFTQDLQFMLRDAGGKKVSLGSSVTNGMEDLASVDAFDGEPGAVKAKTRTVLVQSGTLEGLKIGSSVKVDGVDYEVIDLNYVDEGALQQLTLRDA